MRVLNRRRFLHVAKSFRHNAANPCSSRSYARSVWADAPRSLASMRKYASTRLCSVAATAAQPWRSFVFLIEIRAEIPPVLRRLRDAQVRAQPRGPRMMQAMHLLQPSSARCV